MRSLFGLIPAQFTPRNEASRELRQRLIDVSQKTPDFYRQRVIVYRGLQDLVVLNRRASVPVSDLAAVFQARFISSASMIKSTAYCASDQPELHNRLSYTESIYYIARDEIHKTLSASVDEVVRGDVYRDAVAIHFDDEKITKQFLRTETKLYRDLLKDSESMRVFEDTSRGDV